MFEHILRERVERLSTITEERFARPAAVERDPSTGELVVVAEFVTGSRLSELLDVSAETAAVPGVDVALGYLLECLPALSTLHTSNRSVHGLIDPSRTILTPEGQVVFLDLAFGPAVEALQMSSPRLWTEFGIFVCGNGRVHFDAAGDVTQAALGALMLVLGRNLRREEYPDAIPTLLSEVIEVAHIRGTTAFAGGLQRILQRSLPIVGRRAYGSADEVLGDVRQLVKKEIGLDVCRQALIDFVGQMEEAYVNSVPAAPVFEERRADPVSLEPRAHDLDQFLDTFEVADESAEIERQFSTEAHAHAQVEEDEEIDDGEETELSFDQVEPAAPVQQEREEVYDLAGLDDFALADPAALSSELAAFDVRSAKAEPTRPHVDPVAADQPHVPATPSVEEIAAPQEPKTETPTQEPPPFVSKDETAKEPEQPTAPVAESDESETDTHHESGSARRRKRQQMKSARARKDKLRSTTDQKEKTPTPPPPPPPAPPPKPASPSGWLVSPQRAAASESLIPPPQPVPLPVPVPQPPRPAQTPTLSFSPTPVGPLPQPTYASPATPSSVYGSPTIVKPQPPAAPVQAPPPPAPVQAPQLKIKIEPPSGFNSTRRTHLEPQAAPPPDRFSTLSLGRSNDDADAPRAFPWKLAAVAVGVAAVAIIAGRSYLPGRTAVAGEPGAPTENAAAATTPAAPKPDAAMPAGKGRVSIQTQPPGIKVLLDRKPIGETPVQIDTTPGRHVLTFLTSGGEVLHSVRVAAGKTVALDLPVFSGWVAVFAPILLDVSEDGRIVGTTEQNRLMLPPGRHELTFSNKELGFSETRTVDIEPGGVRNVTVEPKGTANINASPWAEVWLDGKKLGETPLADTPVPLGLHEFVFKHPQHGERKISATIRANAAAQISMDFTK